MDGQASAQSNVLNSDKHGIAKRPPTKYLATVETNGVWDAPLMFPLVYGEREQLYVYGPVNPQVVSCLTGDAKQMAVFPSSENPATSSYAAYGMVTAAAPNQLSHVRVGDVTFIANHTKQPAMKSTAWQGYTNKYDKIRAGDGTEFLSVGAITNDDVWAAWVNKIDPDTEAYYTVAWSEDVNGTVTEYSATINRKYVKPNMGDLVLSGLDVDWYKLSSTKGANNALWLCAQLAYHVTNRTNSSSNHMMQATSLCGTNVDYGKPNNQQQDGFKLGTASVLGRYVNQDGDGGVGTLTSVSSSSTVSKKGKNPGVPHAAFHKTGTDLQDYFGIAWRTVGDISDLPPISWTNHTLKIMSETSVSTGFYMRFVDDSILPTTYQHVGSDEDHPDDTYPLFSPTTSLTKDGHWEEYCGVGVTTDVDSATMPHMVVRRPDGSFAFMEARGALEVNAGNSGELTTDLEYRDSLEFMEDGLGQDGHIRFLRDSGFTGGASLELFGGLDIGASPFVVGDTIKFTERTPDPLRSGKLPKRTSLGGGHTLAFDTTYYITSYGVSGLNSSGSWVEGSREFITISETEGGPTLTDYDPVGPPGERNIGLSLTTYEDLEYAPRLAGDDDSNPLPDFFTNPIKGLSSFQDRLCIFTENEVTLSATSDSFDFFRSTVRDLLDSAPIQVRPSQADTESIVHLIPYQNGLVVVTNRKQIIIYGEGGALSHKTLTISQAAASETDLRAKPISIQNSLYCAYSTSYGGGLYEFYPESASAFTARDVSQQVPGFLPEGPRSLQGSSKHNMLFWLDDGAGDASSYRDRETLYVYSWDVDGADKRQSAWTSWRFNETNEASAAQPGIHEDYELHNIVCLGDRLYMLVQSAGMVVLDYIDLNVDFVEDKLDYVRQDDFGGIMLDQLTSNDSFVSIETVPSADAGTIYDTAITVPWPTPQGFKRKDSMVVVATKSVPNETAYLPDTRTTTIHTDRADTVTTVDGNMVFILPGDKTDSQWTIWVGYPYTMSHTLGPFSPIIGDRHVRGRNVFVRGARMTYSKLPELTIQTSTLTDTSAAREQLILPLSTGGALRGEEFFAVHQNLEDLEVSLINDQPWQSMIQGITYDLNIQEGTHISSSRR
tara:strand:- start:3590 stop:6931 length:3342 start_codon:yes stop_codon:yes gene_type:complete